MGIAQKHVTSSMSNVSSAVNELQQALTTVEKPENKKKIQDAISSLQCATNSLGQYQD